MSRFKMRLIKELETKDEDFFTDFTSSNDSEIQL